jgi:hypothetical protein
MIENEKADELTIPPGNVENEPKSWPFRTPSTHQIIFATYQPANGGQKNASPRLERLLLVSDYHQTKSSMSNYHTTEKFTLRRHGGASFGRPLLTADQQLQNSPNEYEVTSPPGFANLFTLGDSEPPTSRSP